MLITLRAYNNYHDLVFPIETNEPATIRMIQIYIKYLLIDRKYHKAFLLIYIVAF